jgi:hypothetical protein
MWYVLCENYRGIEQLAARQAHNLEVVGSNPTPATKISRKFIKLKVIKLFTLKTFNFFTL